MGDGAEGLPQPLHLSAERLVWQVQVEGLLLLLVGVLRLAAVRQAS